MAAKAEIVSKEIIKPSSSTPEHHRHFKTSLFDKLAPPSVYIPIVLFYSASDISASETDLKTISHKLKTSLSDALTLYYLFCGTLKSHSLVECNDERALYIEPKVPTNLSDILKRPQVHQIKELLPFDPHNPIIDHKKPTVNMAVQLNEFTCGGIGLGVCLLHTTADGTTVGSFLNNWAAIARGCGGNIEAPQLQAAKFFPPIKDIETSIARINVDDENIVTRRFVINGTSMSRQRATLGGGFNPTRVEVVTTLIWRSAIEAAKAIQAEQNKTLQKSVVCHVANIRSRMVPPLPNSLLGNLFMTSVSPMFEVVDDGNGIVGLHVFAGMVRETIRGVDADCVRKLSEGDGLAKYLGSLKERHLTDLENDIPYYAFSSWTRFGFYDADFGWGKPTWVCTIGVPMKNMIILVSTKDGDGIEAWVTLNKYEMEKFESNPVLLQFASADF